MGILEKLFGPPNIENLKAKRNVDGLIKALSHEDAALRAKAAKALGDLKDTQTVEPLVAALKDEKDNVRKAAVKALEKIGGPEVERALAEYRRRFGKAPKKVMGAVASSKAKKSRSRAPSMLENDMDIDRLIENLGHDDSNIRHAVERDLVRLGRSSVQPLISALNSSDDFTVAHAAGALGEIGDAEALEPLITVWKKAYFSFDVARALSKLDLESVGIEDKVRILLMAGKFFDIPKHGKPAVEPLIAALGDEYEQVRKDAICALGSIGDSVAFEPLVKAILGDRNEDVRIVAAQALKRLDPIRAVQPFILALEGSDVETGISEWTQGGDEKETKLGAVVARILGEIGDRRAVEPLIAALEDYWDGVRDAAEQALERIGGPDAERALAEYRARQK